MPVTEGSSGTDTSVSGLLLPVVLAHGQPWESSRHCFVQQRAVTMVSVEPCSSDMLQEFPSMLDSLSLKLIAFFVWVIVREQKLGLNQLRVTVQIVDLVLLFNYAHTHALPHIPPAQHLQVTTICSSPSPAP